MKSAMFCALALLFAVLLASPAPARAAFLDVGTGSSMVLGDGRVDMGCGDLFVAGNLHGGTASVDRARDVTIWPGATFQLENAELTVTGDWIPLGTLAAGSGTVRAADGCGRTISTFLGSTTFWNLTLETSNAKQFVFESSRTTTVMGDLQVQGSSGALAVIRSTTSGDEAFLELGPGATQTLTFVDVEDNHAIGQQIDVGSESILGGNTTGWNVVAGAVPGLGALALGLLALALLSSARTEARRFR